MPLFNTKQRADLCLILSGEAIGGFLRGRPGIAALLAAIGFPEILRGPVNRCCSILMLIESSVVGILKEEICYTMEKQVTE